MPLPLAVSCFSKIQIGFTFLVPAHPGSPGQRAVKRVCVQAVLVAGYCYRHCSLVCLSVLDTAVSSAEVAELIRLLFGLKTCVGPLNRVLDGASVPQSRRGTLQEEVYPTPLWPLASGCLCARWMQPAGISRRSDVGRRYYYCSSLFICCYFARSPFRRISKPNVAQPFVSHT